MIKVLVALFVLTSLAYADEPWSQGVTAEHRTAAQTLLEEGNNLLLAHKYREALAVYQKAIVEWDHPAIRFNMVRCLIALERPLEASENLEKALAYGKAPFEDELYNEALNYQRLLAGEIGSVEVDCKQDGVAISLDGTQILTCPGTKTVRQMPGPHALVGKKPGLATSTDDLMILPGKKQAVHVSLRTVAEATRFQTRWAAWKPWAVVGGGAVVGGLGLLMHFKASSDADHATAVLVGECGMTGCSAAQVDSAKSTSVLENRISIGSMAVGVAALAAGATLVIMNRPRAVTVEPLPHGGGAITFGGTF